MGVWEMCGREQVRRVVKEEVWRGMEKNISEDTSCHEGWEERGGRAIVDERVKGVSTQGHGFMC